MHENNPQLADILLGFGYILTGLIGLGKIIYGSVNQIRGISDTGTEGERLEEIRD